jgi:LuxR family maltose regulon positive regulatory protein
MARVNMFISRPGMTAQMQRMADGARAVAGEKYWSLQVSANLTEAWLLLWQGRIAQLKAALQRIEEDSRWLGQPESLRIRLLTLKVMYQVICDDKDAVHATCDAIAAHASSMERSGDLPLTFLAIVVRASAAVEDWPAVRMHLPSLHVDTGRENPCMQILVRSFDAQLALEEGCTGEALSALRELSETSTLLDTTYLDAMIRTRLALAELATGSPKAAWQALDPLIERVTTSGNVGQVLGTGVHVLRELSLASWGAAASREGLAVLRRWVETAREFKADSQERPPALAANDAGLSARELEVLALLADSQSNKLIARALDLSPHTVKRHVARILDRLDLASRMEAGAWYRTRFAGPEAMHSVREPL